MATTSPGRNQRDAMERLVRLLAVLNTGGKVGVSAERLIRDGHYGEGDAGSQLNRDFRHLREQGWQIENVADSGEDGRYVLVAGDNRLRLSFTSAQQAALRQAALLADRDDLARLLGVPADERPDVPAGLADTVVPGEELSVVIGAVREARLLRFRYRGLDRVVHPGAVRHQNAQWYLSAVEEGAEAGHLKHFVISRMSAVSSDAAGTAQRVPDARLELHPLRWRVDEPVEVVLRTATEFVPDVVAQLQEPERIEHPADAPDSPDAVDLTYVVTHRAALRSRVYALGTRVRVVSPDDVREELLAELRGMAGL